MIPGEMITPREDVSLNAGLGTRDLTVSNTGDRPIQVGSHYHFYEVNSALRFEREGARGFRLDIPAGTAVRFEPGDTKNVKLVALAGFRQVYGFRGMVNGPLGDSPSPPPPPLSSPKIIYYATEFTKGTGQIDISPLLKCAQNRYLTHVLIGLFHLGYDNEQRRTGPYIHLNEKNADDDFYTPLKAGIRELQGEGVKVLASLGGGGGVKDFRNLFGFTSTSPDNPNAYPTFYPKIKKILEDYNFDGIDLDIEEPFVRTEDIKRLVDDLRRDFRVKEGFLISSAPVALAMQDQELSVSPQVNYWDLFKDFDFYILQFYNHPDANLSDIEVYADCLRKVIDVTKDKAAAKKLVAGVLTSTFDKGSTETEPSRYGFNSVKSLTETVIPKLISRYPQFAGICGWTYQNALRTTPSGKAKPIKWCHLISEAVRDT